MESKYVEYSNHILKFQFNIDKELISVYPKGNDPDMDTPRPTLQPIKLTHLE